ncbi:MAG: biopolymer transporter ExbD [Myxococcota bacterium]
MPARTHRQQVADSDVDLTPMLDVVFIMLIFFIVTASFVKEYGLDLGNPAHRPQSVSESSAILVAITESNLVTVAGRQTEASSVRALLESQLAEAPEAPVVVRAHPDSSNGVLATVIDKARLAGAKSVSLAH